MPQTNLLDCLSEHDRQVLDSIFNPLELTSSVHGVINPETSAEIVDIEPDTEEIRQSKAIEVEAVRLAEQGELDKALLKFAEALKVTETRASVYNNRAQAQRLAGKDEDALNDLNKAIELASDQLLKTKCHALCQRGILYRKSENIDAARQDFEAAAKIGSKFAREQLVEINPFAALCNQMLRQAFDKLK